MRYWHVTTKNDEFITTTEDGELTLQEVIELSLEYCDKPYLDPDDENFDDDELYEVECEVDIMEIDEEEHYNLFEQGVDER